MSAPPGNTAPRAACMALPRCGFVSAPKDEHLAGEPVRNAWLDRLAPRDPFAAGAPALMDHGV